MGSELRRETSLAASISRTGDDESFTTEAFCEAIRGEFGLRERPGRAWGESLLMGLPCVEFVREGLWRRLYEAPGVGDVFYGRHGMRAAWRVRRLLDQDSGIKVELVLGNGKGDVRQVASLPGLELEFTPGVPKRAGVVR